MSLIATLARFLRLAAFSLTGFFGLALALVGTMALDLTASTGQAGWSGVVISALTALIGAALAIGANLRLRELRPDQGDLIF